MDLFETNGSSPPALRRALYLFEREHFTSIRVESPEAFSNLPPHLVLRRKAGVWWLVNTAAPKSYVRGDR